MSPEGLLDEIASLNQADQEEAVDASSEIAEDATNRRSPSNKRYYYIDWPIDSDDLSYLNYKSIESLLAVTVQSEIDTQIEIGIIGDDTAYTYKIKHLLRYIIIERYC